MYVLKKLLVLFVECISRLMLHAPAAVTTVAFRLFQMPDNTFHLPKQTLNDITAGEAACTHCSTPNC